MVSKYLHPCSASHKISTDMGCGGGCGPAMGQFCIHRICPHSTRKLGPTASQQSIPQLAQYVMQLEGFNLVLEIN